MTDKQIIIDGIDVSGCTRYCSDTGKCTAFKSQYLCSERNNCYTKRILKKNKTINILKEKLLCKEKECEKLKHKVELMMDCASCKVDEYKQTLAEIKEICNSVENIENINSLYDAKLSGMYLQAHKILQKISECEVNNGFWN